MAGPAPVPPGALWVVAAAVLHRGRCLAVQRSATMAAPLAWELPGGKVEPGEAPEEALIREIREELHLEIAVGPYLGRGTEVRRGEPGPLVLDAYLAEISSGSLHLTEHRAHAWLGPEELAGLDWAAPDRPLLPELARRLAAGS